MKKFLVYIGMFFLFFNFFGLRGVEAVDSDVLTVENNIQENENKTSSEVQNEDINQEKTEEQRDYYTIRSLILENKRQTKESLFKTKSEFTKLILTPLVADKLFGETAEDKDLSWFLHAVYPSLEGNKLKDATRGLKEVLNLKHKYDYGMKLLRQRVKALSILPKDAPIVAKDDEFTVLDKEEVKTSKAGEYAVQNKIYKYVDYDMTESGEPVRRRDKNYVSGYFDLHEVYLAMLSFDLPAMVKAFRKITVLYDGSREKVVESDKGVRSRLLLGVAEPGEEKQIRGVMEVSVPKGMYIEADYLNEENQPRFILNEDRELKNNIESFKFYQPLTTGVDLGNGQTKRILAGKFKFPFEVERKSSLQNMRLKGNFVFKLCDEQACQMVNAEHEITLKDSLDTKPSFYDNYVTQAFARLPKTESIHAKISDIYFDKENQKLSVAFKSSRKFSSIAVMVEGTGGVNFVKPSYILEDNAEKVVFDVVKNDGQVVSDIGDVAISAAFNDYEVLRDVLNVEGFDKEAYAKREPEEKINNLENVSQAVLPNRHHEIELKKKNFFDYDAFMLGFLMTLSPIGFYFLIMLLKSLEDRERRIKEFVSYLVSSLIVGLGFVYLASELGVFVFYYRPAFHIFAIICLSGLLMDSVGYTRLEHFMPMPKVFNRGIVCGMGMIVGMMVLPVFFKMECFNFGMRFGGEDVVLKTFYIVLGLSVIPFMVLLSKMKNFDWLKGFDKLVVVYNLLAIIFILFICGRKYGGLGSCVLGLGLVIGCFLWYCFEGSVYSVTRHARKKVDKKILELRANRIFALILFGLYVGLQVFFIPLKEHILSNPSKEQAEQTIRRSLKEGKPLLISFDADFSFKSLANRTMLNRIEKSDIIDVLAYRIEDKPIEVPDNLKEFFNYQLPRYILFTKRYAQGLKLPTDLTRVDFDKALLLF